MIETISQKKFLAVILISTGLICGLPHILIPLLKPADVPYVPMLKKAITPVNEDEITLAPLMNRPFRDVVVPREGFLFEHRDSPTPREWLPHIVIGFFRLATGSLYRVFFLADFFLPPLIFLSLFIFLYLLTRNFYWSAFISVFALFMSDLLEFIPFHSLSEASLLLNWLGNFSQPPPFFNTRLPTPELTIIFLWTGFIVLFKNFQNPSIRKSVVLGANWGLLFYLYTYYWQAFTGGCVLLMGFCLWTRDTRNFKHLLFSFFLALIISIPFWIEFIGAMKLPYSQDFWIKYGVREGRFIFKFLTLKFLFIIAVGLLLARKNKNAVLLSCFMLSALVCLNQQFILGRVVEPEHWTTRILDPWSCIFLGVCLSSYIGPRLQRVVIFLTVLVLLWAGWIQTSYSLESRFSYPLFRQFEPHVKALNWLKSHSLATDVVLSLDPEVIDLIPVYSYNYAFIHTGTSNGSFNEVVDRIFSAFKLLKVSPEFLEKQLESSHDDPRRWLYYNTNIKPFTADKNQVLKKIFEKESWLHTFFLHRYYYDAQRLQSKRPGVHTDEIRKRIEKKSFRYVPVPERQVLMDQFNHFPSDEQTLIHNFKLDYIYIGPYETQIPVRDLTQSDGFEKVYEDIPGNIRIYRVKSPEQKAA